MIMDNHACRASSTVSILYLETVNTESGHNNLANIQVWSHYGDDADMKYLPV